MKIGASGILVMVLAFALATRADFAPGPGDRPGAGDPRKGKNGEWKLTRTPMPPDRTEDAGYPADVAGNRLHPVIQPLRDGRVLIAGGLFWQEPYSDISPTPYQGTALARASVIIYDPLRDTFDTHVAPMHQGRAWAASSLLPDGRVLVAGGYIAAPDGTFSWWPLLSSEIYDPLADRWERGPDLPSGPTNLNVVPGDPFPTAPLSDPFTTDYAGSITLDGWFVSGLGANDTTTDPGDGTYDRLILLEENSCH